MTPARGTSQTGPEPPRLVVIVVGLAAALLVVTGLRNLSGVLGPLFLALVLTVATQPMRIAAERRGIPGWVGSAAAITTIYAALVGLTVAMTVTVARFATLLPSYEPEANRMLDRLVAWLDDQGVGSEEIQKIVGGFDLSRAVDLAGGLVSGLLGLVSSLFFVITLVLFMVADASVFATKLRQLPPERRALTDALTSFGIATRRYLVVSTVFGLIVAVLDTVALAWMGVPIAMLWGLLAFITNYIPNVGFVIGVVPPAIIGLLEGGPRLMLGVLIVYSVLNVVVQTVIQPKIVGDAVGLSTTLTMLSLVFWAYTFGWFGALLAVPLTLFAKAVLVDADPRTRWVMPLLSAERANGDPAKAGALLGPRERRARERPRP